MVLQPTKSTGYGCAVMHLKMLCIACIVICWWHHEVHASCLQLQWWHWVCIRTSWES